jgi:hypothetical protein
MPQAIDNIVFINNSQKYTGTVFKKELSDTRCLKGKEDENQRLERIMTIKSAGYRFDNDKQYCFCRPSNVAIYGKSDIQKGLFTRSRNWRSRPR